MRVGGVCHCVGCNVLKMEISRLESELLLDGITDDLLVRFSVISVHFLSRQSDGQVEAGSVICSSSGVQVRIACHATYACINVSSALNIWFGKHAEDGEQDFFDGLNRRPAFR